jgi:hypothetical protein
MIIRYSKHVRRFVTLLVIAVAVGLAGLQTTARDGLRAITSTVTSSSALQHVIRAGSVTIKRSANWAGYVATKHLYEDAYGYWRIPNVANNFPNFLAASSQWIGIGLGDSKKFPLVQAGTEADDHVGTNLITYYMWWQVVPEQSHQQHIDLGIIVGAGNLMFAHIHLSVNDAYITLRDVTDSAGITIHFNRKGQTVRSDGHAEWIDERTEEILVTSYYPPLADSTVTFTQAEASAPGLSKRGVGRLPYYANTMWTCARPIVEMADSLPISRSGTKFTIQWKHFGHSDKPGCTPG